MSTAISERDLWLQILQKVEPTMKRMHFVTWLQNTGVLKMSGNGIVVGVPNMFAKDWIERNILEQIRTAAQALDPNITDISFEMDSNLSSGISTYSVDINKSFPSDKRVRKLPGRQEVKLAEGVASKCLNPKYTLANFIVGQNNRLAHAASMSVATNPGRGYNPFFIYGDVGLGKTHLLQAIGNEILKRDQEKIVVYVTSEKFMNEIIEAIGKRTAKSFKDRYRKVDCLIIDDIQFLANKETTQQEFFHTFNELYENNKQIIISSDRAPKDLAGLEDRLVSRFGMGMIVDIGAPDFETRMAILQAKCREHEIIIHPEVLEFIAKNITDSVRELEGMLLQVIAQAEIEHTIPTVRLAAEKIKKIKKVDSNFEEGLPQKIRRATSSAEVIDAVSNYYKIPQADLIGEIRRKDIMVPRQIAMYLIRHELNHPYEKIGEDFGGKNHTTVMHSCEKIIKQLRKDQNLVNNINSIKKEMGL